MKEIKMEMLIFGLFFLPLIILIIIYNNNKKLKKKIALLEQSLEVKDVAISNFQALHLNEKDTTENLSLYQDAMNLISLGESKTNISKQLNIPLNKLELIIKFDKIKKDVL